MKMLEMAKVKPVRREQGLLHDAHVLERWTTIFAVHPEHLLEAVAAVGHVQIALQQYLKGH
jgi:hypothetical protein